MRYVFPVSPMAKPRQTSSDRWKKRPVVVRYRAWCDAMRLFAAKQKFEVPASGLYLIFNVPMPKSWSKKKKAEMVGQPHQQKPDLDNYLKSLDGLVEEDSYIWQISAEKRWAEEGSIVAIVNGLQFRRAA